MRIALAQVTTGRDVAANLTLVEQQVRAAAERGAELVVLPEATQRAFGHRLDDVAEPLDGPFATRVRELAEESGLTVVLGMFTPSTETRSDPGRPKVTNTLLVTGPGLHRGYDKIHLYDAFGFAESATVTAGQQLLTVEVGGLTVGFATCYDVRFPALFTALARAGADAVVVCASWAAGPGKAEQWDLLLRARALDCTSWVLACAQSEPAAAGVQAAPGAPTGIGRSAVIGPDGTVAARAGAGPELLLADVDADTVARVREQLPVLANARLS
ncbi:carbon-nitrogen hydrolase family protein [Desertihabitans aurantiacus]|uniref:carbon-nitrogen hydrolase family protein n=1 Tax=Desertihabitans aurantiacus TaxID=2282477 RepID=UPI000DF72FC5|nr:carbon-nitrogen hydrolase family protein [Desertihabitans aurantiacus]